MLQTAELVLLNSLVATIMRAPTALDTHVADPE
jgi:hypothetical protein